ncbi:hypothetical protein KUCAC02_021756 [Chaenocephalus aceratus]|uniref:Uncharacterized protein n=1 Tax=Chaenocephalus aceratus TaxID=36190 RepID=A0ACB9XIN2_CHAAC|nr:hypothetical protein KUCAC02_021756 [Chaenocephalus aceratus]
MNGDADHISARLHSSSTGSVLLICQDVLGHCLTCRYLRLKVFREDHGSWMTMFFSAILFLFIFSHIYNIFLLMAGSME